MICVERTSIENAFRLTSFNQPLDTCDVASGMSKIFQLNTDQDLSIWDVSNVVHTSYMFERVETFNQPLSTRNVSRLTDMTYMLHIF